MQLLAQKCGGITLITAVLGETGKAQRVLMWYSVIGSVFVVLKLMMMMMEITRFSAYG